MFIWTSVLQSGDISQANAVVKATGPLSNVQAEPLAGFFDLKMGTVQAYWSPGNKRGLLVRSYAGIRPCAIDPNTDNQLRRRIFGGIMLELDGGLARDPLYSGKRGSFQKTFATLNECYLFQEDVISGGWDTGIGFRLSKAWVNLMVYRADESDDYWTAQVVYNALDKSDESDPADPLAAFTFEGEVQPEEITL